MLLMTSNVPRKVINQQTPTAGGDIVGFFWPDDAPVDEIGKLYLVSFAESMIWIMKFAMGNSLRLGNRLREYVLFLGFLKQIQE